jgi:hypothetical protein
VDSVDARIAEMSELTAADLNAYATLLRLEHDAGQGVTLTQASLWDFMAVVDGFVHGGYAATADAQLRGWFDTLLKGMTSTQTSYSQSITGIYIATAYGRWLQANDYLEPGYWAYEGDTWRWPDTPGYWHDAVQNHFYSIWQSTNFPQSLFGDYEHVRNKDQQIKIEQDVVDPAHWNDARKLSALIDGIVAQQAKSAHAIVNAKSMKAGDAIPLLHQLIAMVTSSQAADVRLAGTLVSTVAPSNEYPNDTFINQLVYYVLMQLADPIGNFGLSNAQLQTFMKSLTLRTKDPGSAAIEKSLDTHFRILFSASSYPMVDPYVPSIGFTVRQTDTLAALNAALKDVGRKPPVEERESITKQDWVALSSMARRGGVGAAEEIDALRKESLNLSSGVRLFYGLLGLSVSSKSADLTLAQNILSRSAPSPENPNRTLAGQLVDFVLMAWIDPRGTLMLRRDEIVAEVSKLLAEVPNDNPASRLLQETLNEQAALMRASYSYPMVDPENPSIGFGQRKADTLAALNAVWSAQ